MPTRSIAALFLLALIGYGAVAAWPLLTGPQIALVSPTSEQALANGQTRIEGRALHTETLWLNGAPLLMDQSGNFSASLTLPRGGAILSLTATDRFGREITERRSVFVN